MQTKAGEVASQAQAKAQEIAPQVGGTMQEMAKQAQEKAGPAGALRSCSIRCGT